MFSKKVFKFKSFPEKFCEPNFIFLTICIFGGITISYISSQYLVVVAVVVVDVVIVVVVVVVDVVVVIVVDQWPLL